MEIITPTVTPTIELIFVNNANNREHTATVSAGIKIFIPIFAYWDFVYSFVGAFVFPTFTRLKIGGIHITITSAPDTFAGSQVPNAHTTPKEHQNTAVPILDGFSLSSRFLIPAKIVIRPIMIHTASPKIFAGPAPICINLRSIYPSPSYSFFLPDFTESDP